MNPDNRLGTVPPSSGDLLMAEIVQNEVLSGRRSGLNTPLSGWKKGVMGLLTFATSAVAIACSAPPRSAESTPTLPVPTVPASELTPGANLPIVGKDAPLPPKETPTPEAKKEFDNGMVSPRAYKKAEYIQWNNPGGGIAEGIGLTLESGEEFRIPEDMQVAATESTRGGKPIGYRITAVRKDGSQINILGNVIPVNLVSVGKNLPAGTVVGNSGELGLTYVDKYTQLLILTLEDLRRLFPDQIKLPPKFINDISQSQTTNQGRPGLTFFDVKPPQGG